jgi:hypothetical protein
MGGGGQRQAMANVDGTRIRRNQMMCRKESQGMVTKARRSVSGHACQDDRLQLVLLDGRVVIRKQPGIDHRQRTNPIIDNLLLCALVDDDAGAFLGWT